MDSISPPESPLNSSSNSSSATTTPTVTIAAILPADSLVVSASCKTYSKVRLQPCNEGVSAIDRKPVPAALPHEQSVVAVPAGDACAAAVPSARLPPRPPGPLRTPLAPPAASCPPACMLTTC